MFDGCVCMCAANAKTVSIFFSIFPPSVFVSIRWGPNLLHYLCTSSTIFLGSPVSHTHTVRTRKLYKQNAESNKKSVKIKKKQYKYQQRWQSQVQGSLSVSSLESQVEESTAHTHSKFAEVEKQTRRHSQSNNKRNWSNNGSVPRTAPKRKVKFY